LDSLIDHIVEKHHTYVRDRIPDIEPFLEKVVHVHGGRHPELLLVQEKFDEIKQELTDHMYKEENILFPQIKKLVSAIKNSSEYVIPPYGSIKNPIQMMEMEHESAGSGFKIIRENTHNLQPPSDACQTYRVVFALLDEFETDLHRHIHLENNILFPGAIAYESSIL
jgi:regulator of cell morphogenesis and NO signaling